MWWRWSLFSSHFPSRIVGNSSLWDHPLLLLWDHALCPRVLSLSFSPSLSFIFLVFHLSSCFLPPSPFPLPACLPSVLSLSSSPLVLILTSKKECEITEREKNGKMIKDSIRCYHLGGGREWHPWAWTVASLPPLLPLCPGYSCSSHTDRAGSGENNTL